MIAEPSTIACERCGRLCRTAPTRNDNARLLRYAAADAKNGLCANCGMTLFIRHGDGLGLIFRDEPDPGIFAARHVQESLERLMFVGNADARPEEIDWQTVIAQWDLPFKADVMRSPRKAKKGKL